MSDTAAATPPGLTCSSCHGPLYPQLARRSEAGWVHADSRTCARHHRAEDLRWMAETGESLTGAAKRIGMSRESLERWMREHGMRPELAVLHSREPYAGGWQNQSGAAA